MYLLLITRICHVRDIYMRNLLGFNPRLTASVQNKKKYIFTNTENIVRHSINNILVIVYHTIFIVFSRILSCQSYVFYKIFFCAPHKADIGRMRPRTCSNYTTHKQRTIFGHFILSDVLTAPHVLQE